MKRSVPIAVGLILLAAALWLWESRSWREIAAVPPAPPPKTLAPPLPQPPTRPVPPPHGRNLWDGFTAGSWAMIEAQTASGDQVETIREKFTFLAMEGAVAVLTKDPKGAPDPFRRGSGATIESQATWAESPPKEEKLTIDGKEFACQAREYTHANEARKITNRARVWRSADAKLPYREIQRNGPEIALLPDVLRLEVEFANETKQSRQVISIQVTGLDATLDIGGRKIPCIVEEARSEERRQGITTRQTLKRWISDAVPGRIVRTESEGTSNDKPSKKTLRVVDFEVKPPR